MGFPESIDPSWNEVLEELNKHPRMKLLEAVLEHDSKEHRIFPVDIFKVFSIPLDQVSCCIIGQDPYPNPGQAIGRAFAVSKQVPVPASLRIIGDEIVRTHGSMKADRTLQLWEDQGVMLLNRALTVREQHAGSHVEYWRFFTDRIVEELNKREVPFLLMGGFAKEVNAKIAVKSVHPAAQAYGKIKFVGNGCFLDLDNLINKKITW